jgi:hypothetical protein|tara:strand:- start:4296 stop:4466 length:171 start_codon:yes stop_codon:yes gene_type:complete
VFVSSTSIDKLEAQRGEQFQASHRFLTSMHHHLQPFVTNRFTMFDIDMLDALASEC